MHCGCTLQLSPLITVRVGGFERNRFHQQVTGIIPLSFPIFMTTEQIKQLKNHIHRTQSRKKQRSNRQCSCINLLLPELKFCLNLCGHVLTMVGILPAYRWRLNGSTKKKGVPSLSISLPKRIVVSSATVRMQAGDR